MDTAIDAMSTGGRQVRSGRWSKRHGVSLRRRLPTLAAFVLLLATIDSLRYWSSIGGSWSVDGSVVHARWLAIELGTMGAGVVLGGVIADAARWRGWRHVMLNAMATFTAVGLGAAIVKTAFAADLEAAASAGGFASGNALALHGWWFFSMAGLLFGAFAKERERGLAAIRAAQAAELECIEARRAALELRLQALHARLDPRLLFSLLDEIGRRYEDDPPAADRLLDDLISYLRTALPSNPGAVRTLADEAALVETRLWISPDERRPRRAAEGA